MYRSYVMICGGPNCTLLAGRQEKLAEEFEVQLKLAGLRKEVQVMRGGCLGLCSSGPNVAVFPEGTIYSHVHVEDVAEIVSEHLLKGGRVDRLLYNENEATSTVRSLEETEFYKKQLRIALRNCGVIDPQNIDEYIARDGYAALEKCLTELTPDEVIQIVLDSGLRAGRSRLPHRTEVALCQRGTGPGTEICLLQRGRGRPGAFMDRSVLEGDPHSIIEAMAIAGYAIGASQGYVYIRAEYPIAVHRLQVAIDQAREYGLLGNNIFGTDFCFDLDIKLGAGAFVCGEETALMTSIEGKRGEPRPRPPFPAVKGLFGKPTILNNVETYANVPQIILKGADWFASMGTEKSKGTKVFALGGKIKNTGLVEIPMGTTLRTIVEEIGGGIPGGKKFKAAQTGGPSGGCIPASLIDTPIDYDNLLAIGSMMGSGGLIVMDEDTCMVDTARFYLDFIQEESCGKCTACVSVPSGCWKSSTASPPARARKGTSKPWSTWAPSSRIPPCAAWDRRHLTRFCLPSSTSALSMRSTSWRSDVPLVFAASWFPAPARTPAPLASTSPAI